MVKIGDKIPFIPHEFASDMEYIDGKKVLAHRSIIGTVVFINHAHHWYQVEYQHGGYTLNESFHFADQPRI